MKQHIKKIHLFLFILIIAIFAIIYTVITQDKVPEVGWSKTFGGRNDDYASNVVQTLDGGYILAGNTYSSGADGWNAWIIKTDEKGAEQWNRSLERKEIGNIVDIVSIQQTQDKGYIIAGSIFLNGSDHHDPWLIKTDVNGYEEWNRRFPGQKESRSTSVQQDQDGGFIVAGWIDSSPDGRGAGWLKKTNNTGIVQWERIFNVGDVNTIINSVILTSDGGYMLLGRAESFTSQHDVWLIKTDQDGIKLWDKSFGGPYDNMASSIQQTKDGGYLLAGGTWRHLLHRVSLSNAWVIKTDNEGNELWNMTLRKSLFSSVINSGQQTSDGGYILGGITGTYGINGYDAWLIKLSNELETKKGHLPGNSYNVKNTTFPEESKNRTILEKPGRIPVSSPESRYVWAADARAGFIGHRLRGYNCSTNIVL